MLKVLLADIMCEHPIKVKEDVSVGAVAHLLLRYRINGILVVRKSNENQLVGIFTTTDLLRFIDNTFFKGVHKIEELKKISKMPVGDVASKNVISLQKNTKVAKAITIMHKKNVHTIPVYDEDKLVGVIGRHDIVNVAFNGDTPQKG